MNNDSEQSSHFASFGVFCRKYLPRLRKLEPELSLHAGRMSARFASGRIIPACEGCGSKGSLIKTRLHWRATYGNTRTALIAVLSLMRHTAYMQSDFYTAHGFCRLCYWRLARRRLVAESARYVSFVLLLLAGGVVVLSLLLFTVVVMDFNWRIFGLFSCALALGVAGVVVALWGTMRLDLWCVPPDLRPISKRPFLLYSMKRLKEDHASGPRPFAWLRIESRLKP